MKKLANSWDRYEYTFPKLDLKMKLSFLFVFLMLFQLKAESGYAQNTKITLDMGTSSVIEVMNEIESISEFRFFYSKENLGLDKEVLIKVKNKKIADVLKLLFPNDLINYKVIDRHIILTKSTEASIGIDSNMEAEDSGTVLQSSVTGTVTDENGQPLPGANIVEKGTTNGTQTDFDGNYSISLTSNNPILVFSYIGFKTQEKLVGQNTTIDATLVPDQEGLDEVVVIGYGSLKKSDITGAVGSISEEDLRTVPVLSLDQSLQGRLAGVQVTQAAAQPGGAVSIRIRGGNSITAGNEPLYVIDGFVGAGDLNSINPNDIESVEILKDASATAIYGSRGANGVVLITTKRGESGRMQIEFNTYGGIQEVRKELDLLNASEYAALVNEVSEQNGNPAVFPNPAALGNGTNWQEELFRTAPMQNYQISFSGGSKAVNYLFSANYFNQDGIVENTGFKRYSVRSNVSANLTDKLNFGSSLTISRTDRSRIGLEGDEFDGKGIITNTLIFSPTQPADARVNLDFGAERGNPLSYMQEVTDNSIINRVLGNMFLEYEVTPGLFVKSSFGADIFQRKDNFYLPSSIFEGEPVNGQATIGTNNSLNWLNENTISYRKIFGDKHDINLLAGITAQRFESESLSATSLDFANDVLTFNDLGAGRNNAIAPSSGGNEWALFSYLFRANYIYDNKYLFTATGRYDGSSRFGADNKYAFFPSGAFGWRISNEPFMESSKVISNLKLRTSYGITGSQEIGTFQSLAALGNDQLAFGENITVGYFPVRFSNPDLKWETTSQLDIGLDYGFFTGKINGSIDYYYKRTTDLLLNVPVPLSTGFTTALRNTGELENRGLEFSLNTVNIDSDFYWETSFNYSFNQQEILDLGPDDEIILPDLGGGFNVGSLGIIKVGEPLGTFFGFKTDGILQNQAEVEASGMDVATTNPGDRKLVDTNNDGIVDSDDRVILGQSVPKSFGGITNKFVYKGIDLSVFFQWVEGNSILNLQRTLLENPTGEVNQLAVVNNRWTESNPSNTIPRAGSTNVGQVLDTFVEDGSFLRMRNITLGYDLKNSLIKNDFINQARVYITGNNLLTFTKYKGFDPEVSVFGQNNLRQGVDYGSYPTAKTILIGLNIGF